MTQEEILAKIAEAIADGDEDEAVEYRRYKGSR